MLFSCQNDKLFDDANVIKKQQLTKFKKPTTADALNFINSNLLTNSYASRGVKSYQLEIDTTYTISYKNKPFLKLVCFNPKGYALVSDINNVPNPPVLFYDQNKFDQNNLNPVLIEYIQEFLLSHSSEGRAPTDDEDENGDGAWDDGRDSSTGDPKDSPYYHKETVLKTWTKNFVKGPLLTSQWHQDAPFNNNCRTENGELAKAGCGAIAVGQIMNYHKINTNKNYDWNKINKPIIFKNEIAEFISDIGKGVSMTYGKKSSYSKIGNALIYFKYSGYPNSYETDYDYNLFKDYIDINRPVYLRADAGRERYKIIGLKMPFFWDYKDGHAWVADGYKTIYKKERVKIDEGNRGGISYTTRTSTIGNYIHMNWGWGSGGGWCTYDYFKVGKYNFKYNKEMLIPLR